MTVFACDQLPKESSKSHLSKTPVAPVKAGPMSEGSGAANWALRRHGPVGPSIRPPESPLFRPLRSVPAQARRAGAFPRCETRSLPQLASAFPREFGPWSHTGKVRDIGGPVVGCPLKDDRVSFHLFSPAFFSIEFSVPTGMSSPGWPGTVIVSRAIFQAVRKIS